ncbi:hypothetical protein [Pseudomonas peli]|uniref:hypothetical protein n=1 Tax=Pseudomonas peli TaxID=592361 RepID=UPI0024ADE6D6|nr:hypothetical protein [Pseudomonas peli]
MAVLGLRHDWADNSTLTYRDESRHLDSKAPGVSAWCILADNKAWRRTSATVLSRPPPETAASIRGKAFQPTEGEQ